ncbi:MAG: hypothetical protein R3B96_06570 [Pirellulaceae bacterium]
MSRVLAGMQSFGERRSLGLLAQCCGDTQILDERLAPMHTGDWDPCA